MKIVSFRTTNPFDNGSSGSPSISPTTNKSVIPFNNVTTIQDVLDGRKNMKDVYPGTRGNWNWGKGDEDVSKSYREKADDYKRIERDESIFSNMMDRSVREYQEWKVKVPGGHKSFISFNLAQQYTRENNIPFKYISRAAQASTEESDRVSVISDSLNKVLLVDSINTQKGVKETGSAFCIARNLFLTCAHVVESYNKTLIPEDTSHFGTSSVLRLIQGDRVYSAKLIEFNLEQDLAILESNIPLEPFSMGGNAIPGEDVVVIGSPHGYENNVSTGTIGGLDRKIYQYDGAPDYMFIDASVFPGNSGGPVVRIRDGEVVGMITLIVGSDSNYGLNAALPSSYINKFISKFIS